MNRPADEAAVRRAILPSKRRMYSGAYGFLIRELEDDGLSEDVCDAIAEDPKAMRAIIRRAKAVRDRSTKTEGGGGRMSNDG